MNMDALCMASVDFFGQVPMGVSTDISAKATVRKVHCKFCPKTFLVRIPVLFQLQGAVIIGMIEEVDELLTFVLEDVRIDDVIFATHYLRHHAI